MANAPTPRHVVWHPPTITREQRWSVSRLGGATVWLTGLSGAGKSTVAHATARHLVMAGRAAYVLDGDNLRHGINADLGFTPADRAENVRRVGELARLMADAGLIALVPVIAPYRADRASVRSAHDRDGLTFIEVFMNTPLEMCEQRDPKGLYAKARAGKITGMTGVDAPYEPPLTPDLTLSTGTISEQVAAVVEAIVGHHG